MKSRRVGIVALVTAITVVIGCAVAQNKQPLPTVFPTNALLETPVGNLANTNATSEIIDVDHPSFARARRFRINKASNETNATQLTIDNQSGVKAGDVIVAEFWLRGSKNSGKPAQIEFMFEKNSSPWTKSISQAFFSDSDPTKWRRCMVAFESIADYAPGTVMTSIRLAFGPQVVEIGGLKLIVYGKNLKLDQARDMVFKMNELGKVSAEFDWAKPQQTMMGLGGNFCQPRYGSSAPMDAVGERCLKELSVVHARIGLPLNSFMPVPGRFVDEGPARASLQALQQIAKKGIPTMVSIWEGPVWLQGGHAEQQGRVLSPDKYQACIDGIAEYLLLAKTKYGVEPAYVSFNEPDYGVNFKFTPQEWISFVKQSIATFKKRGIRTKWVVADTANGGAFPAYATPMLQDPLLSKELGPLAFHSWDALNASEDVYREIGELGKKFKRPVWCLEAGHDAQLWQQRNPWESWDNAFRTALAYERTVRLTRAELMDYWTYQDNYPLVSADGTKPFPVFEVMKRMESVFGKGCKVVLGRSSSSDLVAIGATAPNGSRRVMLLNTIGDGQVSLGGWTAGKKIVITILSDGKVDQTASLIPATGTLEFKMPTRSIAFAEVSP